MDMIVYLFMISLSIYEHTHARLISTDRWLVHRCSAWCSSSAEGFQTLVVRASKCWSCCSSRWPDTILTKCRCIGSSRSSPDRSGCTMLQAWSHCRLLCWWTFHRSWTCCRTSANGCHCKQLQHTQNLTRSTDTINPPNLFGNLLLGIQGGINPINKTTVLIGLLGLTKAVERIYTKYILYREFCK